MKFLNYIIKLITDFIDSFRADKAGLSGRKISAAISLLSAIFIAAKLLPPEERIYAVYALLTYSGVCLGLVTIPELITFLSGKKQEQKNPINEEGK
jgi:hypothetical protein